MNKLKCFQWLLVVDLVLFLLNMHYQPLCEPCLDKQDCQPCISKEQYFILYFSVAINLIFGLQCYYKSRKRNKVG